MANRTISTKTERLLGECLAKRFSNNTFLGEIPQKKLANAASTHSVFEQDITALYDATLFGSGSDGLIITGYKIGFKDSFSSKESLSYSQLINMAPEDLVHNKYFRELAMEFKQIVLENEPTLYEAHQTFIRQKLEPFKTFVETHQFSGLVPDKLEETIEELKKVKVRMILKDEAFGQYQYYLMVLHLMNSNHQEATTAFESLVNIDSTLDMDVVTDYYKAMTSKILLEEIECAYKEGDFAVAEQLAAELVESSRLSKQQIENVNFNIKRGMLDRKQQKWRTALNLNTYDNAKNLFEEISAFGILSSEQIQALEQEAKMHELEYLKQQIEHNCKYKKVEEAFEKLQLIDELEMIDEATRQLIADPIYTLQITLATARIEKLSNVNKFVEAQDVLEELTENPLMPQVEKEALQAKLHELKNQAIDHLKQQIHQQLEIQDAEAAKATMNELQAVDQKLDLASYRVQINLLEGNIQEAEKQAALMQNAEEKQQLLNVIHNKQQIISENLFSNVIQQNFTSYLNDEKKLFTRDKLFMSPFMYMTLLNDEAVLENPSTVDVHKMDVNIFGQSIYELAYWNGNIEFFERFLKKYHPKVNELQHKLNEIKKSYQQNEKLTKGVDFVSKIGGVSRVGIGADVVGMSLEKHAMNLSDRYDNVQYEMSHLIDELAEKYRRNEMKFILLFDEKQELLQLQQKIDVIEAQAEEIQKEIEALACNAPSITDPNQPEIIEQLLTIVREEEEEKDEFETTMEYEARLMAEVTARIEQQHHSLQQILQVENQNLNQNYEQEIEQLVNKKEAILLNRLPEVKKLEALKWLQQDEIRMQFYQIFYKNECDIQIGTYNADLEKFAFTTGEKEFTYVIPRPIAKAFKQSFAQLPKRYEKVWLNNELVTKIIVTFENQQFEMQI